jgi:hypothetical protein
VVNEDRHGGGGERGEGMWEGDYRGWEGSGGGAPDPAFPAAGDGRGYGRERSAVGRVGLLFIEIFQLLRHFYLIL